MKSVIFLVVFIVLTKLSKGNFVWLVSCRDNTECAQLKNATCINGFCNCGIRHNVCQDIKILGEECTDMCTNVEFAECGGDNICKCREGFTPSRNFTSCVEGNGKSEAVSIGMNAYTLFIFIILQL